MASFKTLMEAAQTALLAGDFDTATLNAIAARTEAMVNFKLGGPADAEIDYETAVAQIDALLRDIEKLKFNTSLSTNGFPMTSVPGEYQNPTPLDEY